MFIDKADIILKAGNGGDGSAAFRREKFVPKGGPNGGDGGRGGDITLEADKHLRTLLDFARKPKYRAPDGEPGSGYHKFGASGIPLVLKVPCGTAVYKGTELLADLLRPGDKILVARGGRGGRGNVHFKNSVRQAPRIAEKGEPGEEIHLRLRLKIIADVGLIGFPNAGKSTLLSRLTRANPKIANYPFTTLYPNLGVAVYNDREIVLADLPGLIEGAHEGRGLGHRFLAHVERTRVLVHVIDPLGYGETKPDDGIKVINAELKNYSKALGRKPQILVINKMDLTGADEVFRRIKKAHRRQVVLAVSGVSGAGLPQLLAEIVTRIDDLQVDPAPSPDAPVHVRLEPDFWVERQGDGYQVKGKKVERLVAMTNFALPEAVERTQNILRKIGVERQLAALGAKTGDAVRIANRTFTFEPNREPRPLIKGHRYT